MTCWSCTHSRARADWHDGYLECALTRELATERCERFEYEPGTDEAERNADSPTAVQS